MRCPPSAVRILFLIFTFIIATDSRRKTQSGTDRAFEKNDDEETLHTVDDNVLRPWAYDTSTRATELPSTQRSSTTTTTSPTTTSTVEVTTTSEEVKEKPDDVQKLLVDGVQELSNLTQMLEEEHAEVLNEKGNRTVLWLDAKWKAEDHGLNLTAINECVAWRTFWNKNKTEVVVDSEAADVPSNNETSTITEEELNLVENEMIDKKKRLKELGLNETLLKEFKAVGIIFKEVCGEHERDLWFRKTEDAKKIGVDETSPICEPFKEELNPNTEKLAQLAKKLNEIVFNQTELGIKYSMNGNETEEAVVELENPLNEIMSDEDLAMAANSNTQTVGHVLEHSYKNGWFGITGGVVGQVNEDKDFWIEEKARPLPHERRIRRGVKLRVKRTAAKEEEKEKDGSEEWLDEMEGKTKVEAAAETIEIVDEEGNTINGTNSKFSLRWIEIDATEEANPTLSFLSEEALDALGLEIPAEAFKRYEKISLYLPGICADYVPKAIDEFNSSSFEGVEIEGPIGVNISALEAAGVNLTALAEKLRNDTEVDDILGRTNGSIRTLGGSYILPVLNKNQYDPFSAPIVFQGSAVVVRFGIYIESMSNFQTSTMDYDMDIYLMMAWRDARLVNPYEKPILVKEEEILEKIWRPDPFFANAKEAEFHEVTFLNFLMRIFPDGLVLYETRIKLRPACNLILCKYPHDKQTCELQIKSFAYPIETVRFEWFTRKKDAIDKNPDVKLPELYIDRYEPRTCGQARKSGAFSCLRAVFRLKRDVGYHVAQTYIPTSLALMFSWVGVWLPEEFMEGRIGVAITVLLTLSTESAGAREHLPSVSYLKAIDLWFGFITGFVFFTLLQTLFVIGFDKRAAQLRKWAMKKKADVTEELRDAILTKANRYHKTGRYLDNFCRVFYPLSFLLFLIMYYFVFTEGRQDDCISRRD